MKNMMNNKNIYQYLLLPLLACLMAGAAGCSSDASEGEGQSSPDGNTHITFTTRGIVTENPIVNGTVTDYDKFDSYIHSLRIIGFCNGEVKYNQLFKAEVEGNAKKWELVNDEIDITDILSSPVGGTYTFYFIANEEDHTVAGSAESLTSKLAAPNLTSSELDGMGVNFSVDEITGSTPIVMTQKQSFLIRVGQTNSMGKVELVRALAKAQLVIRKETGNTNEYGAVSASIGGDNLVKIYSGYSLMAGSTQNSFGYLTNTNNIAPISIGSSTNFPTEDGYTYLYKSNPIYLPEKSLEETVDAINMTTTIADSQGSPYSFAIGDPNKNFSIERNTEYTTTVTFLTLYDFTFNVLTTSWGEKTMDVPPFE